MQLSLLLMCAFIYAANFNILGDIDTLLDLYLGGTGYEGYSKGAYDGKIATMANDATSIATNLNITLNQAIEALNVPSDIRDEVRQRAEQILKGQE